MDMSGVRAGVACARLGMERFVTFTPLEMFALLMSAAVHDLRHPGVNNNFLVTTGHPLATRYNDKSVSVRALPFLCWHH